jgi:hypothetical protein
MLSSNSARLALRVARFGASLRLPHTGTIEQRSGRARANVDQTAAPGSRPIGCRQAAALGYRILAAVALTTLAAWLPAAAQLLQARIVVQSSPLAGFRHYEAPNLWSEIKAGDRLVLVREPDNPHDRNAVRVEWRGFKLGYVPRRENEAVARQLDRGVGLIARVSKLRQTRAPNKRIEFEIYLPL